MNPRTTPGETADQPALAPSELPLVLGPAPMAAALADGTAIPLTSHVHYRGVWWLDDDDAWLQITDQAFAATLQTIHDRRG